MKAKRRLGRTRVLVIIRGHSLLTKVAMVLRQKFFYPVRKPRSSAAGMGTVSFSANTGFNAPCKLSR